MPTFRLERSLGLAGPIAGLDEAGRGPLAGPVVAAAVVVLEHKAMPQRLQRRIDDSKKLPREEREAIYAKLHECKTVVIGVGQCSVEEIDTINILRASLLAMRRALDALPLQPLAALVDGNQKPDLPCAVHTVVKGDAKSLSIAAASIIAKVTRDRLMYALADQHPQFGWHHNVGYATPEHRAALERHGPTPHHRRSFIAMPLFAGSGALPNAMTADDAVLQEAALDDA
jgi:ribonuclease HII